GDYLLYGKTAVLFYADLSFPIIQDVKPGYKRQKLHFTVFTQEKIPFTSASVVSLLFSRLLLQLRTEWTGDLALGQSQLALALRSSSRW
ncbi:MAG: hypothetical protein DBX44_03035, partial [Oscillospiraceae bacterium]